MQWMHAVCSHPIKSTWVKAINTRNFVDWSLLTKKNILKYYLEADVTMKGHMYQTRKNLQSTKCKPLLFEQAHIASLCGKKIQDVFTAVYDVLLTDQTGKFPTRLHCGNKYVMVMVKIDSNVILLELLKRRKDPELICEYDSFIKHPVCAGVTPQNMSLTIKSHPI